MIALSHRGRSRCAGWWACTVAAVCCATFAVAATNSLETGVARSREDRSGLANLALQVVGQIQSQQQATLRAVQESSKQNAETIRSLSNRLRIAIAVGILLTGGLLILLWYVRAVLRSLKPRPGAAPPFATPGSANGIGPRITSLLAVGEALLESKQASRALVCFDEVLVLDEHNAGAYVKKGAALEQLGRLEDALACYDQALSLDVALSDAYVGKGAVYNRLERYGEALECYDKAARLRPAINISQIHSLQ
ncbi:MAG TPA: tetratricopeptide repeat protein [Verrucomicrobiae bacterium]|nr:tetratricopeptide repeat protein [Verrucomicrobiae bacterium]